MKQRMTPKQSMDDKLWLFIIIFLIVALAYCITVTIIGDIRRSKQIHQYELTK
jgi:K+-transporting ATPase c subunit